MDPLCQDQEDLCQALMALWAWVQMVQWVDTWEGQVE